MRSSRAPWIVSAIVAAVAPLATGAALACSCAPVDRTEQVRGVAAIFIGEVIAAPEPPRDRSSPGAGKLRYRFRVEAALKGETSGTVDVSTAASPAACGASFVAGERYLVFARDRDGVLETGLCDFDVSGDEIDPVAAEVRRILGM